ncbi:MAG: hypothetical protein F4047_06045 [Caldilineaceae bacterium SB0670_bin_27]|nr:hypothetical protein [Caldilineaceae bacterium SB0670_bin_27]
MKELEAKLKEANLGKLAAENRARVLEELTIEAHEQTRAAEIALAHAQSETSAAEVARQRAEDLAQESEYAREAAEKRAVAAEAGQFRASKLQLATIDILQKCHRRLRRLKPQLSVYRNGMHFSEQTQ